jgi:hypothetical protein
MGSYCSRRSATGSKGEEGLDGCRDLTSRDNVRETKLYFEVSLTYRRYGQTNCFVGPSINYGIFEASDSDLFLVTERSARNMAFQGIFDRPRGVYNQVIAVQGADLLGTRIRPPFGLAEEVYVLPMEGVLATKVRHDACVRERYSCRTGHRRRHIGSVRLPG